MDAVAFAKAVAAERASALVQPRCEVPTILGALANGLSDTADQDALFKVLQNVQTSRRALPGHAHGYEDYQNGIQMEPGIYNAGDLQMDQQGAIRMVARVPGTVTVMIPDDTYFIETLSLVSSAIFCGISFIGGKGAYKAAFTSGNVTLKHIFENCLFLGYTECAVQNSSNDNPNLIFRGNILMGAEGHETIGLAWGGFLDSYIVSGNNFLRNAYHIAMGPRLSGTAMVEHNDFLSFGDASGLNRTKADIWIKPNVDAGGFGTNSGFASRIASNKFGNENQLASSPRILIANEGGAGSGTDRGTQRPAATDNGYVSGFIIENNRFSAIGGVTGPVIRSFITAGLRQLSWRNNKFDGGAYSHVVEFANAKSVADYADTNSECSFDIADVAAGGSPPAWLFSNAHFARLHDRACFWPGDANAVEVHSPSLTSGAVLLAAALNPTGITRFGSTTLVNRMADPDGGTDLALLQSGANETMAYLSFAAPAAGGTVWADLMVGRAPTRALDRIVIDVRNSTNSRFALKREIVVPANVSRFCVPMLIPPMANPNDWQLRILPSGYASGTKDRLVTGWWTVSAGGAPIGRKAAQDRWPQLPRNRAMTGAVAGTPGTLPTGWALENSGGLAGIGSQLVKHGADAHGAFIDLRLFGTATAGGLLYLAYDANAAYEHDGSVSSWRHEVGLRLIGGSFANLTSTTTAGEGRDGGTSGPVGVGLVRYNVGGGYQSEVEYNYTPTADYAVYGKPDIGSTNGATAAVRPVLQFAIANGAVIDFTLRIYQPDVRRIT